MCKMSLQGQYVRRFQTSARSEELYVCVFCQESFPITEQSTFKTHVENMHSNEVERCRQDPNFDLESWHEAVRSRSRTVRLFSSEQEQDESSNVTEMLQDAAPRSSKSESRPDAKRKPTTHRKLAPRSDQRGQPGDPGGGSSHKRPRSSEDQHVRTTQSKSSQRRAIPPNDSSQEVQSRSIAFQGNWGTDGQPTRTLFNPVDASVIATAGQVTLPSRSAESKPSDKRQKSPSSTAAAASKPTSSNLERGVLPVPNVLNAQAPPKERGISMPVDPRWPDMLLQPDSRPISQEQLAAEVKSIYAGLTMVESKCIHVDKAQAQAMRDNGTRISDDHWQALIALHRTLLHEHHDFFLASQHPSASPALRRLASKYSMAARMWKHGIHSFLELLRYRLPDSFEFMVSFIYTAYQMMSLLYETVPAFKNTWIECLGDLGRYRMAIEDEDFRDRENWANVSRFWYSKAADRSPEVGRLYHHLAILARPNALQQLSLYARSLISVQIFKSARESILTLFNPILARSDTISNQISSLDMNYVKAHAILFTREHLNDFEECHNHVVELLDQHIGHVTAKWREQGAWVIIALLGALFDYGNDSPLRRSFDIGFHKLEQQARTTSEASDSATILDSQQIPATDGDIAMDDLKVPDITDEETQVAFKNALVLYNSIATIVMRRQGDKNVLPFIHIMLAFLLSLAKIRSLDARIESAYVVKAILSSIPCQELCAFLNTLNRTDNAEARYEVDTFIRPEKENSVPLPEDYLIRGQVWSQDYFPADLFRSGASDDEEKNIEHASTMRIRTERVLNLAYRLSLQKNLNISYDSRTRKFSCVSIAPVHEDASLSTLGRHLQSTPEDLLMPGSQFHMEDTSSDSEEDSPENKYLKQQLTEQLGKLALAERASPAFEMPEEADDILKCSVTYIVFDEACVLRNQDVFKMLVQRKWKIIVPNKVIHELSTMSATTSPEAKTALEALEQVRIAYASTELKILDVKELSLEANEIPARAENSKTRPAVLVTDNKRTRVRAARNKLAALAPNVLKAFLETKTMKRSPLAKDSQMATPEPTCASPRSGDGPHPPAESLTSDIMETEQ
ncbi:hypothetical protein, variant [Verruconis gallopava]|uniref:Nonsense-mediated mRNA decay factor n=1 Tax=Verruconis gallopava TaxID=253628 RepID=A0A0D2A7B4_9PEZI|nr:hypothetical protein, variant [Verruconis gallopava]KIW02440.1 hypothetical protein, variant [Verruconis gallopava]